MPPREVAICLRLKEARERLGLNQQEFARRAGSTRGALSNYELCHTPLRYDLALRICRTFIISEEWLATNEFKAIHAVAPNFRLDTAEGKASLGSIFYRLCMDLASEPVALEIPRGTLFSVAYDTALAPVYARLTAANFPDPRIKRSILGDPEISVSLLDVYVQRWLKLLGRVAPFSNLEPEEVQNPFLGQLILAGDAVFGAYMGFDRPELDSPEYEFLKLIATDRRAQIGPLNPPSE